MNKSEKAISILIDAVINLTDSVNELKNQIILLQDKLQELKEVPGKCQNMMTL